MKSQLRGLFLVVQFCYYVPFLEHLRAQRPRDREPRRTTTKARCATSPGSWTWCRTNYAEPVDVDKAVYQGAIPGHAAHA